MEITRRTASNLIAFLPAVPALSAAPSAAWTPEWDRALILASVEAAESAFNPAEMMLGRRLGHEYRYHTSLRGTVAHATRDSLTYALMLFEAGGEDRISRALQVVGKLVSIQEKDPESKWYGLWGYYLEEPAPKMAPADWNWADFNGSLLLLIENRHRSRLPSSLRAEVLESIRHAAYSVRRRNVSMNYTNIAVKGTFVTLAAAELLGDADLLDYAKERIVRFCRNLDETGSFAEYNSPVYSEVTIGNITRMRMVVKDADALPLAEKIHHRAWMHLAERWHAPTRQLAGPMSRTYSNDIGRPLWIQKALGGRLSFATLEEVRSGSAGRNGETGVLEFRCPPSLESRFLETPKPRQHRELFLSAKDPVRPVLGATWIEPAFTLGTTNRADFWVQRRPLLAYWGSSERPARCLHLRFLKDAEEDYDFASALFYSVQQKNYVLGLVNFRSPGGDKHVSLDPVPAAGFPAKRLRLQWDLSGVPEASQILVNGKPWDGGAIPDARSRVALELGGGVRLWLQHRRAAFAGFGGRLSIDRSGGKLSVALDLLEKPGTVQWSATDEAYVAIAVAMEAGRGGLQAFDRACSRMPLHADVSGGKATLGWKTPTGGMGLEGSVAVAAAAEQDRAFRDMLDGNLVPIVRLSDERLA